MKVTRKEIIPPVQPKYEYTIVMSDSEARQLYYILFRKFVSDYGTGSVVLNNFIREITPCY